MLAGTKLTVVIGLGRTGWSCARFLQAIQRPFLVMDTREEPPTLDEFRTTFPGVQVVCGGLDEGLLLLADEIIVSPGVATSHPLLQLAASRGVPLVGDIDLFARHTIRPVVAITGSNAKSTVTTLVGEMAKSAGIRVAVGGNLGTPVLDLLDDARHDWYVLELSSFQLETTRSLKAKVAAILNISDDHMDRYDSQQAYVSAKQRIYRGAENVVYNRADTLTFPQSDSDVVHSWSFGLDGACERGVGLGSHESSSALCVDDRFLCNVVDVLLPGKHNLENVAASLAIVLAAGWPLLGCIEALKTFRGLPHRCEWVMDKQGVKFYNDSKGTNIGATIAAIKGLAGSSKNVVLLAGGDGKGADFSALAPCVDEHVKKLVLIGRDAERIAAACSKTESIVVDSLDEAVRQAAIAASMGDIVLLSPACASFDMFTGYDDRGRQFCRAVELLP